MGGASSRNKGASGERELCRLLETKVKERTGVTTRIDRNITQARDGGHDVLLPVHMLEVKRRKKIGLLLEWLSQVEQAAHALLAKGKGPMRTPLVVCRADKGPWLVVMSLDDWFDGLDEHIVQEIAEKFAVQTEEAVEAA
jgi:hypothetical protein